MGVVVVPFVGKLFGGAMGGFNKLAPLLIGGHGYGRIMEISKVAIKICRHGWDRRDSDGSFSMARLMAAVNEKISQRNREIATLHELLVSFNISKKDKAKPRYEVLCRYSTREDWHSFRECIFVL